MTSQHQPLIELFAEMPDFRRRANAIPYLPCSRWPVVRCDVATGARVPSPNRGTIMVMGALTLSDFHTTRLGQRRCIRSFGTWTVTLWKRNWAPGLRVSSQAYPQPPQ